MNKNATSFIGFFCLFQIYSYTVTTLASDQNVQEWIPSYLEKTNNPDVFRISEDPYIYETLPYTIEIGGRIFNVSQKVYLQLKPTPKKPQEPHPIKHDEAKLEHIF